MLDIKTIIGGTIVAEYKNELIPSDSDIPAFIVRNKGNLFVCKVMGDEEENFAGNLQIVEMAK